MRGGQDGAMVARARGLDGRQENEVKEAADGSMAGTNREGMRWAIDWCPGAWDWGEDGGWAAWG